MVVKVGAPGKRPGFGARGHFTGRLAHLASSVRVRIVEWNFSSRPGAKKGRNSETCAPHFQSCTLCLLRRRLGGDFGMRKSRGLASFVLAIALLQAPRAYSDLLPEDASWQAIPSA